MYAMITISQIRNLFDLAHQTTSHGGVHLRTIQYIHQNVLSGVARISLQLPITINKIMIINLIMMIISTKFQPIIQL